MWKNAWEKELEGTCLIYFWSFAKKQPLFVTLACDILVSFVYDCSFSFRPRVDLYGFSFTSFCRVSAQAHYPYIIIGM